MKAKKGFTLIELLVVVSIIALLVSILMPALGRAKGQAESAVCLTNLKQIVLAAGLWSMDNDDWCVPAFCLQGDPLWGHDESSSDACSNPGTLEPYLSADMNREDGGSGVIACPTARHIPPYVHGGWSGDVRTIHDRFSYATNGYMTANSFNLEGRPRSPGMLPTGPGRDWSWSGTENESSWPHSVGTYGVVHGVTKINRVRTPSETLYFTDCDAPVVNRSSLNPFQRRSEMQMSVNNTYNHLGPATRWHAIKSGDDYGYGNIGWVDGHASREPGDFADGTENDQNCWYYLYGER